MPEIPKVLLILLEATPVIKYGLLFLLVAVEGPIATMGAGLLSALKLLHPVIAYVIVVTADMVGDCVYYALGHWGRTKTLHRLEKYFGKGWPPLERLEQILHKRTGLVLIGGKLTHLVGMPVLLAAGAVRIPFGKFLLYDLVATIPKSLVFMVIGFYFGRLTETINTYLKYGTLITLGLIVLVVLGYVILGRRIGKEILS